MRGSTGAAGEQEKEVDKQIDGLVQEDTEAKFSTIKTQTTASALEGTTSAYQSVVVQIS